MTAAEFASLIMDDRSDFLREFLALLDSLKTSYCVIGGLAVNAYAEPVVSLDLDLIVVADQIETLVAVLERRYKVTRFPHSVNVSSSGSDLRLQIQTDSRYQAFIARSSINNVLGHDLSVAALEDVLQGKVWAYTDPERRPSKRQKDLSDILRLIEGYPHLKGLLPADLRAEIQRLGV